MGEFAGWSRKAVTFLRELEDNNDRDWFKANRARYDEFLLAPAQALAADLSKLGEAKFFRPHRDTRFHPGPPIKEHVSFTLGSRGAGLYYVEFSLDGVFLGAGIYHPESDQLDRWRRAVDDGRKAGSLGRAIAKADAAGMTLADPDLTRAPRGYPPDHPRLELLRRKRLVVFRREKVARWVHTAECGERVREALEASRPLVRWLGEHVGPTTRPRRARG